MLLGKKLTKYLYVLSFDGLSTLDFDYIKTLPHFQEFLARASYCKKVVSVYPTLTYPAHVTIMTGRYPKNHGVINNTLLQPNHESPDWFWQRRWVKGQPLFELAAKSGLSVAALLWPVTAKARIRYNLPEIFPNRPWQNQVLVSLRNGSPWFQWVLNYKYASLRHGLTQPYLDNFVHQSLMYTLKQKRPELVLAHYTDLDSMRHYYGVDSPEAREALHRLDQRLGDLVQTLKETNMFDESAVVVLGDHGHLDADKIIKLNVLLKQHGHIDVDARGRITAYRAIAKSCDGSTYIYLNPQYDSSTERHGKEPLFRQDLMCLFQSFNQEHHCFEAIYSQQEALNLGADPKCAFMLEANKGYYFLDSLEGEVLTRVDPEQVGVLPHHNKATHGYSPFKADYTTVFLAAGKGIKEGMVLDEMNLVDEGPTLAKLLGLSLADADGRSLDEILTDTEGP